MKTARPYVVIVIIVLTWLSVRPIIADRSLGSPENPIRIMLTPSTDAQAIIKNGEVLAEYLALRTGLSVRVSVPNSYVPVVEALGTARADMAIMNTFSYLLANDKYGARAVLRVVRRNGELSYRGEIITRFDSGIDSLRQIHGKTMAYVDPSSTSGYLYPKELLKKMGIKPSEEMFANGHNQVVLKVYQGSIDAGAVFYSPPDNNTGEILDARCKVVTQYPDVYKVVKVLALTQPIPNDPVVFRKEFPLDYQAKIIDALMEFQLTEQGKKSLMSIASIEGFVAASDNEYSDVRQLVAKYGVNLEKALTKKK